MFWINPGGHADYNPGGHADYNHGGDADYNLKFSYKSNFWAVAGSEYVLFAFY